MTDEAIHTTDGSPDHAAAGVFDVHRALKHITDHDDVWPAAPRSCR